MIIQNNLLRSEVSKDLEDWAISRPFLRCQNSVVPPSIFAKRDSSNPDAIPNETPSPKKRRLRRHSDVQPQNSPIVGTLLKVEELTSDLLFDKDGEPLPLTRRSPFRIQLDGTEDEMFQIELLEAPVEIHPKRKQHAVGMDANGIATCIALSQQRLYLIKFNTAEIAQRLLITKEKIDEEAKAGSLGLLLQTKKKKLHYLPKLIKDFRQIDESRFTTRYGDTFDREGMTFTEGFNKRQMMKIVRTFHRVKSRQMNQSESLYVTFNHVKDSYGLEKVALLVQHEGHTLKMTQANLYQFLGEGISGAVFKVPQLDNHQVMAAKRAHYYKDEELVQKMRKSILNEYHLLKELDGGEGIQDPPHALYFLGDEPILVGKLYDGCVYDLVKSPEYRQADLKIKLDCCRQVLAGGLRLIEHQILHADQKLSNCFYEKRTENNQMFYTIKIADFGGAVKFDEIKDKPKIQHTRIFTPPFDVKNGFTEKTAVYQQGNMLFKLLTNGDSPWLNFNDETRYPIHENQASFNEKGLVKHNLPLEMCALIREMCDPLPENRPESAAAKARFDTILQAYHQTEKTMVARGASCSLTA